MFSVRDFFICVLFSLTYSQNNVTENKGILSQGCANSYFRMYVTRRVPPRNYLYFHETLSADLVNPRIQDVYDDPSTSDVPIGFRIVGGQTISITQAPYQVLYGLYCGGSLLAPDWVITAAHCKEKEQYVYAGSTRRSMAVPYKICAHFVHPLWNKTNGHLHDFDYQLLLLERPVPVTPSSRPIAIGTTDDIQDGLLVGVTGWGHLKYKKSTMQDNLRRVFVPIMSYEECTSLPLDNYKSITPRMFCAGYMNGTKDACQGDSGGPAVAGGKLLGMVSFGVGCALEERPGVYSRLPVVRDWIRSVTALPL